MQWFHDHPWMTFILAFMLIMSFNNLISALTRVRVSDRTNKDSIDE